MGIVCFLMLMLLGDFLCRIFVNTTGRWIRFVFSIDSKRNRFEEMFYGVNKPELQYIEYEP